MSDEEKQLLLGFMGWLRRKLTLMGIPTDEELVSYYFADCLKHGPLFGIIGERRNEQKAR